MDPFKKDFIENIKTNKINKPLIFVHTPKCAGSYVGQILKDLKIKGIQHNQAKRDGNAIYFTVIRDPIKRFESLLNYRLGEYSPRKDWPQHLHYVYNDTSISLNHIIKKMTDDNIRGFIPYRTLTYWSQNVDICIEIHELKYFLELFGYTYDESNYLSVNVSKKVRGTLNAKSIERLTEIYKEDIDFYNKWTKYMTKNNNF
jgi:hypothetical protein